jgi:hypothetical protein
MSTLGVGKEVLSHCNKCKLTLAHIIVTMKSNSNIGKVQCKTCTNTHAYKDPSAVKSKKVKGRRKGSAKSEESISDIWMDAISKSKNKSKEYSTKDIFNVGDIIDHPKFGPGIVEKNIDNDKIEVLFRHNIRTLIHNRV